MIGLGLWTPNPPPFPEGKGQPPLSLLGGAHWGFRAAIWKKTSAEKSYESSLVNVERLIISINQNKLSWDHSAKTKQRIFPSHRFTHSVTLFSRCYFSVNCFYVSNGLSVTSQVVTNFINCFNVSGLHSYIMPLEQKHSYMMLLLK